MSNKVHSDADFRDAFLHGAARAFFVCAYADFVEDDERESDGHDYPGASNGGGWYDVAPDVTPPNAYALAGELWAGLASLNKTCVYSLACMAERADGLKTHLDAEDFGRDLAMESMGHGVSWFDDHKSFPLKFPSFEVHGYTFDPEAYRG